MATLPPGKTGREVPMGPKAAVAASAQDSAAPSEKRRWAAIAGTKVYAYDCERRTARRGVAGVRS